MNGSGKRAHTTSSTSPASSRHVSGDAHRDGDDDRRRTLPPDGGDGGPHRGTGCQPVVHDDHGAALDPVWRPVAAVRPNTAAEFGHLAREHLLQRLFAMPRCCSTRSLRTISTVRRRRRRWHPSRAPDGPARPSLRTTSTSSGCAQRGRDRFGNRDPPRGSARTRSRPARRDPREQLGQLPARPLGSSKRPPLIRPLVVPTPRPRPPGQPVRWPVSFSAPHHDGAVGLDRESGQRRGVHPDPVRHRGRHVQRDRHDHLGRGGVRDEHDGVPAVGRQRVRQQRPHPVPDLGERLPARRPASGSERHAANSLRPALLDLGGAVTRPLPQQAVQQPLVDDHRHRCRPRDRVGGVPAPPQRRGQHDRRAKAAGSDRRRRAPVGAHERSAERPPAPRTAPPRPRSSRRAATTTNVVAVVRARDRAARPPGPAPVGAVSPTSGCARATTPRPTRPRPSPRSPAGRRARSAPAAPTRSPPGRTAPTSEAACRASGFMSGCLTCQRPDICSTTSLESIRTRHGTYAERRAPPAARRSGRSTRRRCWWHGRSTRRARRAPGPSGLSTTAP